MTVNLSAAEISDLKSLQDRVVQTALDNQTAGIIFNDAKRSLESFMHGLQYKRGVLAMTEPPSPKPEPPLDSPLAVFTNLCVDCGRSQCECAYPVEVSPRRQVKR